MAVKLLTPVDVIIDSREDSKHPEFKVKIAREGLRVAVQELPAGDFLLLAPPGRKQSILVERKSADDFANSIRDGRIWEQSKLLQEAALQEGHRPLIVIEGSLEKLEKYRNWRVQSILRVIDTLVLDMNIPILYTPHKDATIAWIIAKAKNLGKTEEKRVVKMRVEKKPLSIEERVLYVTEGLVGPTLARRLLARFKTLKNVANASTYELMSVEGIGEKRAQEIYAIFNTPWHEPGLGEQA
ncbi:MAG: ERCC4 domain-containing protein [Desulfurococcaceae archaeon]